MKSGTSILQEILDDCSDSERRAAVYMLENTDKVLSATIADLGKLSGSSAPAIIRLCKKAGLSGYRELQMLMAKDMYTQGQDRDTDAPDFHLEANMSVEVIAREIIRREREGLERLLELVDLETLSQVVDAMRTSRVVFLAGVGASNLVAADLALKLLRLGIPCVHSLDTELQITSAAAARPGDLLVAFSWSGETEATLRVVHEAKACGCRVVAVTRMGASSLGKLADWILATPAAESRKRVGAMVSRIAQLALVDILYATLVSRDLERALPLIEKTRKATHPARAEHKE